MSTEAERLVKIETDLPYIQRDITELRSQLSPIVRDNEELKSDIIRYLNRIDLAEKNITSTDDDMKEFRESFETLTETVQEYSEQIKFVKGMRKTMNAIFIALAIQFITLVCGLLAFVFVMTQKTTKDDDKKSEVPEIAKEYIVKKVKSK